MQRSSYEIMHHSTNLIIWRRSFHHDTTSCTLVLSISYHDIILRSLHHGMASCIISSIFILLRHSFNFYSLIITITIRQQHLMFHDDAGAAESLLHFLETVDPVTLLDAVVSKAGKPCLADVDVPGKTPVHRDTCAKTVEIYYSKAVKSGLFSAVSALLLDWKKLDKRYNFVQAKDIIGVMFLYAAEHPFQYYKLISEPFHTSGERIPLFFACQKPTLLLLYLASPLLMTIPGLDYCGPVHRGIPLGTSDVLKGKHRNFMTAYAPGTLIYR